MPEGRAAPPLTSRNRYASAGRRSRATTARWSEPGRSCTAKSSVVRPPRHEHVVDLDAEPPRQRRRERADQRVESARRADAAAQGRPQRAVVQRGVEVAGHDGRRLLARPAPDDTELAAPAPRESRVAGRGGVHREQRRGRRELPRWPAGGGSADPIPPGPPPHPPGDPRAAPRPGCRALPAEWPPSRGNPCGTRAARACRGSRSRPRGAPRSPASPARSDARAGLCPRGR